MVLTEQQAHDRALLEKYFASDEVYDEIRLKAGGVVKVRQSLSAGERAKYQRMLMSLDFDPQNPNAVKIRDLSWEQQMILTLQFYIIDWDLGVPYSRDLVPNLRAETLDEIASAIDEIAKSREENASKKGVTTDAR